MSKFWAQAPLGVKSPLGPPDQNPGSAPGGCLTTTDKESIYTPRSTEDATLNNVLTCLYWRRHIILEYVKDLNDVTSCTWVENVTSHTCVHVTSRTLVEDVASLARISDVTSCHVMHVFGTLRHVPALKTCTLSLRSCSRVCCTREYSVHIGTAIISTSCTERGRSSRPTGKTLDVTSRSHTKTSRHVSFDVTSRTHRKTSHHVRFADITSRTHTKTSRHVRFDVTSHTSCTAPIAHPDLQGNTVSEICSLILSFETSQRRCFVACPWEKA